MGRVVVHHALHPDEGENGIYRLIHAEAIDTIAHDVVELPKRTVTIREANPDFEPRMIVGQDDDGNYALEDREDMPMFLERDIEVDDGVELVERTETVHVDHQEVVWDAGAKEWKGLTPEEIAADQRRRVTDAIKLREKLARAAQKRAAHEELPGVGGAL